MVRIKYILSNSVSAKRLQNIVIRSNSFQYRKTKSESVCVRLCSSKWFEALAINLLRVFSHGDNVSDYVRAMRILDKRAGRSEYYFHVFDISAF